ncbi:MAG: maleylpyruvate isomerase N-terminal domain-containing protein [Acidimicrobiales bacterium]
MPTSPSHSFRTSFAAAAGGFAGMVGRVPPGSWDRPGLGTWTVRDLVGHASRALSTVDTYLAAGPSDRAPGDGDGDGDGATIGPVAYYLAARGANREAIAERGRAAGLALGPDPADTVDRLARQALVAVEAAGDDAPVAAPFGPMTLAGYLPTRTFELAVHGLDLGRAAGIEPPAAMAPAIAAACELAGALAGQLAGAADFLLLVTGRTGRLSVV